MPSFGCTSPSLSASFMSASRPLVQISRDEILSVMERIYRYRMTTTSGGNLSIRDGDDVWITLDPD